MKLFPPAKINLSLRILGCREDGYHEIETLMTCITLEDSLSLEVTPQGEVVLECSDPTVPSDHTNLAVIAANAYLKAADLKSGVHLILEKHIPHGAGLGGGSSDAAFVLLGLNALFGEKLTGSDLVSVGAQIGSDVSFFLRSGVGWCRGRGEIYEPVDLQSRDRTVLLMKPPFSVPTPWAYKSWKNARRVPGLPYEPQSSPWGELRNDLEVPVFEKYPLLGWMKRWLLERGEVEYAFMSGSGSTLFAILREEAVSETEKLNTEVRLTFGDHLWVRFCQTRFGGSGGEVALPKVCII